MLLYHNLIYKSKPEVCAANLYSSALPRLLYHNFKVFYMKYVINRNEIISVKFYNEHYFNGSY